MSFETIVIFSFALGVAAVMPGPGIFAMVARALGSGFWPALPMAVGMILGDLMFLTLVVLGLTAIAQQLGGFLVVVKFAGAAYLIYLGCRMWAAPVDSAAIAGMRASGPIKMWLVGLVVTLSNPKTILFFLALLPTVIDIGDIDGVAFAQLSIIVVVVDAMVLGVYAALAARTRRLFSSSRLRRRLNRCSGAAMIGVGGAVAANWPRLRRRATRALLNIFLLRLTTR